MSPVFPDVTLCSLSGVLWEKMVGVSKDPHSNYNLKFRKAKKEVLQFLKDDSMNATKQELVINTVNKPSFMFANLGNEAKDISYTINDLILFCFHSNKNCSESDFELFQHPDYFSCYTYNKGRKYQSSMLAGPDYGLTLTLYTEALDLVTGSIHHRYDRRNPLGNTKGIRVVIHTPGSYPNILEEGIDIMPGISTSVSLAMVRESRIDAPYADCYKAVHRSEDMKFLTDLNSCRQLCKDTLTENK